MQTPEKYLYDRQNRKHQILQEIIIRGDDFCITDCKDESNFTVVRKSDLVQYEETYLAKRHKQLDDLSKKKEELVRQLKNKAIKSIAATMKLNAVFTDGGKYAALAVDIADRLSELIENDTSTI